MRMIALAAALAGAPALAQDMPCADRGFIMEALEQRYGEVSVGYGYDPRNLVVEVYVSAEGTWTLLGVGPDGTACMLAAGTDWVFVEQPWPQRGELN